MMKKYLILFFLLPTLFGYSQIITNPQNSGDTTPKEDAKKQPKKEKEKKERVKGGVELFFGVSPAYTYRTLKVNEGLFAKPLGERVNEKGKWTTGYHLGARTRLNDFLKLEFGAGYYTNKETYSFEDVDTVFRYTNLYRQVSVPIRLVFTYGEEISFYGGIGVIPSSFLHAKREVTTLDISKHEKVETWKERDKYNLFLLDGVVTLGTQIKFGKDYGMYFQIEGRRQFNSNYTKQHSYIRKPYALGFNVGFEVYL